MDFEFQIILEENLEYSKDLLGKDFESDILHTKEGNLNLKFITSSRKKT